MQEKKNKQIIYKEQNKTAQIYFGNTTTWTYLAAGQPNSAQLIITYKSRI